MARYRVADQHLVILRNGLIPEMRINYIKNDISREIGVQNQADNDQLTDNSEQEILEGETVAKW